jgi:hypothetical protein
MLAFSPALLAQEEFESDFSMDVSLNTDAFFGYAPAAFGAYGLSDGLDLTFYGIFWSPGTGQNWGNWTEFGLGVNLSPSEGLDINPAIGVLGGNLLNSGGGAVPSFPDGVVPNLTVNYASDLLESNLYFGYYTGLSEGELPQDGGDAATTNAYIHTWASVGIKAADWVSAGAKYEQLDLSGGSNIEESVPGYTAVGGYLTFADPKGRSYLSFFAAPNLADEEERFFESDSFWKMTAGFSF